MSTSKCFAILVLLCIAPLLSTCSRVATAQRDNETTLGQHLSVDGKNEQGSTWSRENEVEDASEEQVNCSAHSIEEFPEDLFTAEQRRHGAVILHVFFGCYCFLLTAFVCNDYLLPALDLICSDMGISADVAGATFLATASCFPELFVNVVGTFLTESDLGVGTVVGGAVFNTFATPACGALCALHGIQLEWRILTRDCIIYVMSVGILVIIMWDGLITWYEAMILMILFAGYLLLLFCSGSLMRWYNKIDRFSSKKSSFKKGEQPKASDEPMPDGSYKPFTHGELIVEYRKSTAKPPATVKPPRATEVEQQNNVAGEISEEYIEPDTPFVWPSGGASRKAWFLFSWPLKFILFVTIPDSRYKRLRNWYPITFIMCVSWIAVSSYLVSWMTTVVGDTLGIPDSVMGITFLSAGGNMPEMVSIVILSKQGNGDMAMSNTLGANTLDILLCLGLPWLIKVIMTGQDVEIISGALSYSVLSILLCVIGFYAVTALCKYKLNKKVGLACLLMYAIFLVFAVMIELNVFFHVNWPMCAT